MRLLLTNAHTSIRRKRLEILLTATLLPTSLLVSHVNLKDPLHCLEIRSPKSVDDELRRIRNLRHQTSSLLKRLRRRRRGRSVRINESKTISPGLKLQNRSLQIEICLLTIKGHMGTKDLLQSRLVQIRLPTDRLRTRLRRVLLRGSLMKIMMKEYLMLSWALLLIDHQRWRHLRLSHRHTLLPYLSEADTVIHLPGHNLLIADRFHRQGVTHRHHCSLSL